jgi:hypothetical protein
LLLQSARYFLICQRQPHSVTYLHHSGNVSVH